MKKRFFFFLKVLLLLCFNSHAKCNFKSADFINKLDKPEYISSIDIKVYKKGKYEKNFIKTLISLEKQWNIPSELKINYKAKILVHYKFGSCEYEGSVRQTGDLSDHIDYSNQSKPKRSLKVTLDEGNILNAVKFKLFIPEARNNLNEILGTMILKHLGFLAPETTQVQTFINNIDAVMLFQEDIQKEFLEKNRRREGPIFEGDETLLWSNSNNYEPLELWPLSLSRMSNQKWMTKENSTKNISLNSFAKLQKSYLEAIKYNKDYKITPRVPELIFPNSPKDELFNYYTFILLALNGTHGLSINNRKYYYNSFIEKFEPIYYDGNLNFSSKMEINKKLLIYSFNVNFKKLLNKINQIPLNQNLYNEFEKRILLSDQKSKKEFNKMISNFIVNSNYLFNEINKLEKIYLNNYDYNHLLKSYVEDTSLLKYDQEIITYVNQKKNNEFDIKFLDGKKKQIIGSELISLLENNKIKNKRYVLLKDPLTNLGSKLSKKLDFKEGGYIKYSNQIDLKIDYEKKKIDIKQKNSNDWIIFRGVELIDWEILFEGIELEIEDKNDHNILNDHGLTGCLNFYNSNFNNVKINIYKGECEDSLNIINSRGSFNEITIKNSFSDALDADFSELFFDVILIKNAGNDCVDLSGGIYEIQYMDIENCNDKGISIGEKSVVYGNKFIINNSYYGISSKDLSKTSIKYAKINHVNYCYQTIKKKEEFGGSSINFDQVICDNDFIIDINSKVEIKNNEL